MFTLDPIKAMNFIDSSELLDLDSLIKMNPLFCNEGKIYHASMSIFEIKSLLMPCCLVVEWVGLNMNFDKQN